MDICLSSNYQVFKMNPFSTLSDDNHEQIRKYLKFFRLKKEAMLRALQREIDEVKADRLNEDMYTREDVSDFADFLSSAVKAQISGDVSGMINMGALALNQLLENSQEKGVDIQLETSSLENQALIEAIEKMSLDAVPRAAKKAGTLASFRDEAKLMRDETSRLEETNARLQAEVSSLRERLLRAEKNSRSLAESKYSEDVHSKELERALEEAKEENSKRVAETSQFQQMRKMMQAQSSKIRELRKRLQKYEPDACKEEDDNDC